MFDTVNLLLFTLTKPVGVRMREIKQTVKKEYPMHTAAWARLKLYFQSEPLKCNSWISPTSSTNYPSHSVPQGSATM